MKSYDFQERLDMSNAPKADQIARRVLAEKFSTQRGLHRAHKDDDKLGADYIVILPYARTQTVDVKVRSKDYAPAPDVALEIWSNVDAQRVGWSRDPTKLTDWVLWVWTDTERTLLLPFIPLQAVFAGRWQEWYARYGSTTQTTSSYRSQCLFIPSAHLVAAINEYMGIPSALEGSRRPVVAR